MKSKITKIQNLFMKGIAIIVSSMLTLTPVAYASTSLDDNNSSIHNIINTILHGTVGNTVEAIKNHFDSGNAVLVINNEQQLRAFAEYVNMGNNCSEKVIKLGSNISVNSNEEWVPIGKKDAPFKGTFIGNNNIISGINFNRNNKLNSEITNVGLFGYIENANVKNVKIDNSRFSIPYNLTPDIIGTAIDVNLQLNNNGILSITEPAYSALGAVVGYNKEGKIENCSINNSQIAGLSDVGGIVGYNDKGTVSNCKTENSSVKALKCAGGVVGTNDVGTVTNTTNTSSVYAFQNSGGIVGANYGSHTEDNLEAIVKNSNNTGKVSGFIESIGGVVGRDRYTSKIEACKNEGLVKIETNDIELQALKSYLIKTTNDSIGIIEQQNIGGIAGWVSGNKEGQNTFVAKVNSCVNSGNVEGVKDVGGLVGQLGGAEGGKAVLSNSINQSPNVIPVPYSVNSSETTSTETANGESGFVTGEIGADEATVYLYNNKYKKTTDSQEETAGKIGEDTVVVNNKYNANVMSKEYGTIKKDATVYFLSEEQGGNEQGSGEQSGNVQEGMEYIPEAITFSDADIGYKDTSEASEPEDGVREIEEVIDEATNTKVKYSIYKVSGETETQITGEDYLKEGDTLKIVAVFDKYLASYYGPLTQIDNNVIKLSIVGLNSNTNEIVSKEMVSEGVTASNADYTTTITYTYKVNKGEEFNINNINLSENGTVYAIADASYETNHPEINSLNVNTSIKTIRVDTVAPKIETRIFVENELETGCYTAGKEIFIEMTTSEEVKDIEEIPELQVSFSKSGIGKYNYKSENGTAGFAKPVNGKINEDKTLTILYSYQIQKGDEGELLVSYANGEIIDLAGNSCNLSQYKQFENSDSYTGANLQLKLNGKNVASRNTTEEDKKDIEFIFYKNEINEENRISKASYIKENDKIIVQAKIKGFIYVNYDNGTSGNYAAFLDDSKTAYIPKLTINDKVINGTVSKNHVLESSIDQATYSDAETTITYTISGEEFGYNERTLLSTMNFTFGDRIFISNRYVNRFAEDTSTPTTNESETGEPDENSVWDISAMNRKTTLLESNYSLGNIDIRGLSITIDTTGIADTFKGKIYADTTLPTVEISAKKKDNNTTTDINGNVTNANTMEYTFTWSEAVVGFTAEDITINNGTKDGNLSEPVEDTTSGKVSYTMVVVPSVENGNTGDIQVIVEQDAAKDIVGQGNVRTESIIRVDKQAPILVSLEAYGDSDIDVNREVDTVKQYYKVEEGKNITIVATFNENIQAQTIPTLELQFSESGNAKGQVSTGLISGNKITYTYSITDGDNGKLSVKGFSGIVKDPAGNETVVTKRALDGDTIIADTIAPRLEELKVVSPEDGTYKAENKITIEAIYDEDVYILNETNSNSKEIQLLKTNPNNVPELALKFGSEDAKNGLAIFEGYAKKEDGTEDRSRLVYSYTIKDAVGTTLGDNGELSIKSYTNKSNLSASDIAGNKAILNVNKTGNNIIADTIRPIVTKIEGNVENPTINNTEGYYKEGNKVKITLTFSEEVSSAVLMPKIQIGFSEDANVEPTAYNDYAYESNWNVNSETVEYTYTIKDGDNGYLWIKVPENQFEDIAGNKNEDKSATRVSNIFADTTRPTVTLLRDTEVNQNNQIITIKAKFSEDIYDLNENNRTALKTENAPKLIYSFGTGENKEAAATSVSGDTITYRINKDAVNDNGTLRYELAKGNLCDRAGNLYYIEATDTTAPELLGVTISSDSEYGVYCKKDVVVTIKALFDEDIATQNMKMKIKIGEKDVEPLTGTINNEYKRELIFNYTIKENDNGLISIVDVVGNTTNETPSRTFGWVRDEKGNQKNIFDLMNVTVSGTAIADTTPPVATITVYPDENYDFNGDGYINDVDATLLQKYIDQESIEANVKARIKAYGDVNGDNTINIIDVTALLRVPNYGKNIKYTRFDIITYTITWSEPVSGFDVTDIDISNGLIDIDSFKKVDEEGKVYTVNVDSVADGIQTLKVISNACIDRAGNANIQRAIHDIMVDRTKPQVRIRENGGNFVLGSNGKSLLKTELVVNEPVSEMKYIWSKSTTIPEDSNEWITVPNNTIGSNSDIPLNAIASETGTYYLYMKVSDLAGKTFTGRTNGFVVSNDSINITSANTNPTNRDVVVNLTYGAVLTENRKAGIQGKTQSADPTKVILTENGVVYAEATDKNGNKVYATLEVTNIDKTAPTAAISYNTNENGSVTAQITFTEEGVTVTNQSGIEVIDGKATHTFTENGEFTFEFRDTVGNIGTAVAKVTSINKQDAPDPTPVDPTPVDPTPTDTTAPEITDIMVQGRRIAISANESDVYYLITTTSEKPNKNNTGWAKNNIITVNSDGTYYAWVMDDAKNISTQVKYVIVDTSPTTPVIDVNTNDSRISKYTEDGITYILVSPTVSVNELKDKITVTNGDRSKLSIDNKSSTNRLKTTSLIKYDGNTKFVIVVQGDVNRDGEVSFNDVLGANSMRGAENNYLVPIRLAADLNGDRTVTFNEVLAINAIRTK